MPTKGEEEEEEAGERRSTMIEDRLITKRITLPGNLPGENTTTKAEAKIITEIAGRITTPGETAKTAAPALLAENRDETTMTAAAAVVVKITIAIIGDRITATNLEMRGDRITGFPTLEERIGIITIEGWIMTMDREITGG